MVHLESKKVISSLKESEERKNAHFNDETQVINSDNNNRFPVVKIDPKGKIIYANKASSPVLKAWNCYANNIVPQEVLSEYPALVDLNSDTSISFSTGVHTFCFSVVGFPSAGFIGVYGYKIEPASSHHSNN
jgi:hypothetical protein